MGGNHDRNTVPARLQPGRRGRRSRVETGLAAAEWYHTDVPRKQMKELMQRSDGPAIRDTIDLARPLLVVCGAGGVWFWGSWWCVPFFLVYGVLYGSATDSAGTNAATAPRSRRSG